MDVVAGHGCPNQDCASKEEGENGSSLYLLSLIGQKSKLRSQGKKQPAQDCTGNEGHT